MNEPQKFTIFGDEGPNNTTICRIATSGRTVRLPSGRYRLVCGVPRKLWPFAPGTLHEVYEYELVAQLQKVGNR